MKFTVTNPDGSEPDFAEIYYEEWVLWRRGPTIETHEFAVLQDGSVVVITNDGTPSMRIVSVSPPGRFTVHMGEDK